MILRSTRTIGEYRVIAFRATSLGTERRWACMAIYDVAVKHKIPFMELVIRKFCGNAHISFEGDLSRVDLRIIRGSSISETPALKRNTIYPIQDFIIVPLEEDTRDIIISMLHRIGIRNRVDHLQIETAGEHVFGSYDNFQLLWVIEDIGEAVLADLLREGIIKNYKKRSDNEESTEYHRHLHFW
ncbi:MAG: hypothetical protein AB9903_16140 [Vulcanimicrobiota bacterium]